MRLVVGGVDLPHIFAGNRMDFCARPGVAGHAATEMVDAAGDRFFLALAQKVDVGDDGAIIGAIQHHGADAGDQPALADAHLRSEEHTSELQSLMPTSYSVFCL